MRHFLVALAAAYTAVLPAQAEPAPEPSASGKPPAYTPGLGEFMGAIQMRHAKLWFAGEADNWPLASYELGEIRETLHDAATYDPDFKGRPIARMISTIIEQPIENVQSAIDARDSGRFVRAFDDLSNACGSCHRSAGFRFIVIQRPTTPPLSNQRFFLPDGNP